MLTRESVSEALSSSKWRAHEPESEDIVWSKTGASGALPASLRSEASSSTALESEPM